MTHDHPLLSLVYCSTATGPVSDDDLERLLKTSRTNNDARDITGLLLYRDGEFIQILEGDRYDIEKLMVLIRDDPRHEGVRILLEEPLRERRFENWTMGHRPLGTPQPAMSEGYRDSFEDLRVGDHDIVGRALMELTTWFRVRESRPRLAS